MNYGKNIRRELRRLGLEKDIAEESVATKYIYDHNDQNKIYLLEPKTGYLREYEKASLYHRLQAIDTVNSFNIWDVLFPLQLAEVTVYDV